MQPLTLDDLIPLDEYAGRRREFFESQTRYLDRYRRVRIGPRLTMLFENRQTLWFRLQEILRIARLAEPERVQQELDLYNSLLPGRNQLQAVLLIDIADETQLTKELAFWQTLRGEEVCLRLGGKNCPARLITCRPEDRCIGAAHWAQFDLDPSGRRLLSDFNLPAYFEVHHDSYQHQSSFLGDEVRQSLIDDLELSDLD